MGKHIQEDSYYGKMGFSSLKIGEQYVVPENTSSVLELLAGYGISLEIVDNKIKVNNTLPVFSVKEW